ncbi:MAG TPA: non-homologous end-joining DNA ligase [Vicinamibacteria bacterium]
MITHPEKVLFPGDGITKGALAAYYESVAPAMLPHLRGRPVMMERYPAGIGAKGFMHRDVRKGYPEWLERVEVPKKGGTVQHPIVSDTRSLLWMANQNCITPHVWLSRVPALHRPDLCVFDLDPSRDDWEELRAAAIAVRTLLDDLGLATRVKTSGWKGYHVVVPLDGQAAFDEVAAFAHAAARVLVARDPDRLTLEFTKAERAGRIYLDVGRNGYGATLAAVYAVRARPGAPVSAPCTWAEVEAGRVRPRTFTIGTMAARLAEVGELWAEMPGQSLRTARERLAASERR